MRDESFNNDFRGLLNSIPVVEQTDPDERRRAALYVVSAATDVDDARMLLDMLGLGAAA